MSAPSRLHTMYVFLLINPQSSKKKKKKTGRKRKKLKEILRHRSKTFSIQEIYIHTNNDNAIEPFIFL